MKEVVMIAGKKLQLENESRINLNIQINNISDISTRNSSYSNTITVPRSSYNEAIFELAGCIGNTTRLPYQKLPCQYFRDGVAIISNGYLQITDVNQESYKVVLYDGVIDLSEALKDKKLRDLVALAAYNHTLDEATYSGSFSNTEGFVYAFADYGVEAPSDSAVYPLEYQVPSLYIHTLVDEILTEAGFTYEGSIFTDPDYLSLLVAPSNGYDVVLTPPTITPLKIYDSDSVSDFKQTLTQSVYNYQHDFTLNTSFTTGVTLVGTNVLRVDFTGRMRITMSTSYVVDLGEIYIRLKKNGVTIKQIYAPAIADNTITPDEFVLTFPVNNLDEITLEVEGLQDFDSDISRYVLDFSTDTTLTLDSISGGQLIDFNVLFDDVLQSAVLKDIMQHYGLLVIKDFADSNNLIFKTFEELLQDKINAEDWTQELVRIDNESFSVDGYARNNNFVYKYESDVEVFDYDGELIIDNEHLEDEKTLIGSIFKIRNSNYRDMLQDIYTVPLFENKTIEGVSTNVPKKTDLTLFKINLVNDSIDYNVYGGSSTAFSGDVAVMTMEGLQYQDYIDTYYAEFKTLLDTNKRLDVVLNLNSIEVANLDFFRLKYLKQTGKYYYLNSIKNNGGLTKAELIEINN